ncbi:hypothetical protein [Culicoidibacter larvae]|uniref:DUF2846 domain-containing protein n=1 Tax=Culicoidibacter larvae TaxID=2579976 RepID=A0A5R8QCV8_9FIRM|nr:hypothetical protein [Culicoidibacter larvae]TLG72942.1 hypothetical protein FEZ08_07800 [Culicoidibacter larvae]
MATVVIKRSWNWFGLARNFKIDANGQFLDKIANNQTKAYQFLPGKHELQVNMDKLKSPVFEFEIAEEETIQLQTGIDMAYIVISNVITFIAMIVGFIVAIIIGTAARNFTIALVLMLLWLVIVIGVMMALQYTVFRNKMYYIRRI